MTPKPPPAVLARVRDAIIEAARTYRDERATVAERLQVSLPAAMHLIAAARGEEVVPDPPRTLDR